MAKHKKQKIKTIVRHITTDTAADENKIKKEVEELEEKRKQLHNQFAEEKKAKGKFSFGLAFSQFRRGMGVNRDINQRRSFLRQKQQIRNMKNQVESEKVRSELNSLREKNKVDFNSLYGSGEAKKAKGITLGDIGI